MEEKIIELEVGDIKAAASPKILYSGGLGPCVAVAAYDQKNKLGYMVHDPAPEATNHLRDFLQLVEEKSGNNFRDISGLVCYVAGGSLTGFECIGGENESIQNSKRIVEQELSAKFRNVKFSWSPLNHVAELYLNTANGKFDLIMNPEFYFKGYGSYDEKY
ncbi:MAG: hypothetical protein KKA62_02615 [Nanoarchaeota archaeon]|nr:hypothetical protein [Nanoarchaeota archaeon]MBU1643616.1 hypothetical protein [Nanoarchaeota archaeon]MBU1976824.1 hypothetical protein [Nanoarchaeota archaeon]